MKRNQVVPKDKKNAKDPSRTSRKTPVPLHAAALDASNFSTEKNTRGKARPTRDKDSLRNPRRHDRLDKRDRDNHREPGENKSLPHAQRLSLVWRALESMSWDDSPLDDALARTLRSAPQGLTDKDHQAIRKGAWGFVRRYHRLLWWLAHLGYSPSLRRSFLLDQFLGLGQDFDDFERNFRGGKVLLSPLTKGERELLQKAQDASKAAGVTAAQRAKGRGLDHPAMPEDVRHECPDWAYAGLQLVFGQDFAPEMAALNEDAPLDLRVNPLKTDREQAAKLLSKQGWKTEPLPQLSHALRCINRPRSFSQVKAYQEGLVEVQDYGSQMIAALLEAQPGERVVDFCAGAGGKALAIAAGMDNRGQLVLTDVHSKRLRRAAQRLKRAGVFNAERQELGSERDPWVKYHKGKFHRVLVDAPCSGTGAWRRGADAKWRKDAEDLRELCDLQASILKSAARLLRLGGRLVYATCSFLPCENEVQIGKLLRARPDFKLLPVADLWAKIFEGTAPDHRGDYLRLSPFRDGTDGFFAAVLERKSAP